MNTPNQPPARIMVVDDAPPNLQFLERILGAQGYRVFALPNGDMALHAAAEDPPDLILLDILMPGPDGYEVCTRLKAHPRLRDIPVIFLSALSESWDKVRAFQVGGVDYVTKPFQAEEVEARVQTHLELSRQRRELRASFERLRELEHLRDSLTQMIVHDLRSPLTVIGMTLELLGQFVPGDEPGVADLLTGARRGTQEMAGMIAQLLDISRMEAGQMPLRRLRGDLVELAEAAQQSVAPLAGQRRVVLQSAGPVIASHDGELVTRVLRNLLVNAFKFTPDGTEVRVCLGCDGGEARVTVTDSGGGIPAEDHAKIFEKFGQAGNRTKRQGTGLGLAFCKLAVAAHGGRIGVESQVGRGSTFWFTLPLENEPTSPL
jgi:signal transduction histidine kinase